jgi:hypothetical protein
MAGCYCKVCGKWMGPRGEKPRVPNTPPPAEEEPLEAAEEAAPEVEEELTEEPMPEPAEPPVAEPEPEPEAVAEVVEIREPELPAPPIARTRKR